MLDWRQSYKARSGKRALLAWLVVVMAGLVVVAWAGGPGVIGVTNLERVSVGNGGIEGDGPSLFATSSDDGRIVTYESLARNWADDGPPSSTNWNDIFYHDRLTGFVHKITFDYLGQETGDNKSVEPYLTDDGRYIAYTSQATNLVPDDTNSSIHGGSDVFLHDRVLNITSRVSLNWQGQEIDGGSYGMITGDGRYIVFRSNGINVMPFNNNIRATYIYVRDWRTGAIEQVLLTVDGLPPNGRSEHVVGSFDGRHIVFESVASNLVGGDSNGARDVFYVDRQSRVQRRVTVGPNGEANGPSGQGQISGDGRFIVFSSEATNLVANDTNGRTDVFLYELATRAIRRVSVASDGTQGNNHSSAPSICDDGRFVSFISEATNLVPGDVNGQADAFIYDVTHGQIRVASTNSDGEWGDNSAYYSFLTPNCGMVVYSSSAGNLVADDTNGERDIFKGDLIWPADLGRSYHRFPPTAEPGEIILYQVTVTNDGHEVANGYLVSPIPNDTTYVAGSGTAGVAYDPVQNRVQWTGDVLPGGFRQVFYQVTVDPDLEDPTAIMFESILSGDGLTYILRDAMIVSGYQTFLPMIK